MSLFSQLFNKKKELRGEEIASLLRTLSVHRDPLIVKVSTFKFVTDILAFDDRVFHLKNTLTRDEVIYHLKGKKLHIMIPYELTIYGGDSRLIGLGMVSGMHSLKLQAPVCVAQEEARGAYRVTRFQETPSVTFTTDSFDIVKARLMDISMTGAGMRLDPRWEQGNSKLKPRTRLILDIRLDEHRRVSTTATVRYVRGYKAGVEFEDLPKSTSEMLFRYVVESRREAQRALVRIQQNLPSPQGNENTPVEAPKVVEPPKNKPTALVVGERQKYLDYLTTALSRKFDLLYSGPKVTEIRNHLELLPSLCLMELKEENQEQVAQMRKASGLLAPGCVLMFYGRAFSEAFRQRFAGYGYPEDILVSLHEAKKLLTFKQIQGYFGKRLQH